MSRCMTDTDNLTAVADAIRTKGGTSAQLVYPAGFVSAIQAIQTGVTPKLVVTTSAGAAVTAIKGSKTVSGTADTDGTCTLEIPEAGEWSVTSTANGLSDTQSIVIGTQSMSLFSVDPVFANNSWAGVVTACRRGTVPSTWVVGDSMPMTIGGTDYQQGLKQSDVFRCEKMTRCGSPNFRKISSSTRSRVLPFFTTI